MNKNAANLSLNTGDWTVPYEITSTTDSGFKYIPATNWYWTHWNPYPVYSTSDRGIKAFEVAKKLQEMKLVNLRTAKQFAELMDAILSVL